MTNVKLQEKKHIYIRMSTRSKGSVSVDVEIVVFVVEVVILQRFTSLLV